MNQCQSSTIDQILIRCKNQSQGEWKITVVNKNHRLQELRPVTAEDANRSSVRTSKSQICPKAGSIQTSVQLQPCLFAQMSPLCELEKTTPLLKLIYCHVLENHSRLKGTDCEQCTLELYSTQFAQRYMSLLLWQVPWELLLLLKAPSLVTKVNLFLTQSMFSWFSLLTLSGLESNENQKSYSVYMAREGESWTGFTALLNSLILFAYLGTKIKLGRAVECRVAG